MSQIIAIDGPSASGKSTVAARLAAHYQIAYVNTGSMFRAVAWRACQSGAIAPDGTMDAAAVEHLARQMRFSYVRDEQQTWCLAVDGAKTGSELRRAEIAALASKVATLPGVREALKQSQRAIAARQSVVMEGRDIGTVIFPDARFKFFITASPEERARRRLAQHGEVEGLSSLTEVAHAIAERDRQDASRAIAPLKPASDAITIDNSTMTIDEVVAQIVEIIDHGVL